MQRAPREPVVVVARGKWHGVLMALGVQKKALDGNHRPCPACGGEDRFRFEDKDGTGSYYCNVCGPGHGMSLVMKVMHTDDFAAAARAVERVVGAVEVTKGKRVEERTDADKLDSLRRMWDGGTQVTQGDEVWTYLTNRGLVVPSTTELRCHPSLLYREQGRHFGHFPGMIARVLSKVNRPVTIHRTFLKDGKKAPVPEAKKAMPGMSMEGAAVRLYRLQHGVDAIGVAEGIETAIAAHMLYGIPVWAVLGTAGMESFEPPDDVSRVIIFGDNDMDYAGQKAAYTLAHRLHRVKKHQAQVELTCEIGDMADELARRAG